MKRISLFFVLPLVVLTLMACRLSGININRTVITGSGDTKTEERSVKDVERVSLRESGDMTIIQGDEEGLTVEADENILPYLVTRMEGHELVIETKNGVILRDVKDIHYTLKVKSLKEISVSGSGNVTSETLDLDDLAVSVTGAGNVNFPDLAARNLTIKVSGSGNFDLAGQVDTQDITITGSGNYRASDLQSKEAQVAISGSGDVTVWATDSIDARITGFGNIRYYGNPSVSQSITGGGTVKGEGDHK